MSWLDRRSVLAATVAALWGAPAAADTFTFTIPGAVTVTSGTPVSQTVGGQPAAANALGYSLSGNWTAGAGDPWSSEFLVSVTPPGGTPSPFYGVGGVDNGNPFTFPNGYNNGGSFVFSGDTLPTLSAGSYTVRFDTDFPGSTANLAANSQLTVYYNPVSVTGSTVGGPTFNRPDIDGGALSTVGTAVRYTVTELTVATTGRYMVASSTPGAGPLGDENDGVVLLYQNSFNPSSPLTNFVVGGDPFGFALQNVVTAQLTAGTTYVVVTTGYDNDDAGPYTLYAAGPGTPTLTPVPEPAVGVLLAAVGLLGVRSLRRGGKNPASPS
jgi:hypothetical protein